MKIEFIRSYIHKGRKQVKGQRAEVWPTLGKELIKKGVAKPYYGPWPPGNNNKTKTDFFKPK